MTESLRLSTLRAHLLWATVTAPLIAGSYIGLYLWRTERCEPLFTLVVNGVPEEATWRNCPTDWEETFFETAALLEQLATAKPVHLMQHVPFESYWFTRPWLNTSNAEIQLEIIHTPPGESE